MGKIPPISQEEIMYQIKHIDDNRGTEIVVVTIILAVLPTLAVISRFFCRRLTKIAISWDDYLIVAGLVFTLALCFCQAYGVEFGSGKHVLATPLIKVQKWAKLMYAYQMFWAFAMACIKVSILLFYRRLFPEENTSKKWRICHLALIVASVVCCLISVFGSAFACTPVALIWDYTIEGGHCINLAILARFTCITGFVTDLLILMLPIPIVWSLQLDPSKKVGVCGVFLLGSFVCVASVVRFVHLESVSRSDPTWSNVDSINWTAVEASVGIICACLPIMAPFLRTKLVAIATSVFRSKKSQQATTAHTAPSAGNTYKEKKGFARLVGTGPKTRQGSDEEIMVGTQSPQRGEGKSEGGSVDVHELKL
ncbi:MAG: hypothetical protein Q9184_006635 [Pyrenodesmia sp. 2 TL-2023]